MEIRFQDPAVGSRRSVRAVLALSASSVLALAVVSPASAAFVQQGEKLAGSGSGFFGDSVAVSADGNTALIGEVGAGGLAGQALIFTRSGGAWSAQARLAGSGLRGDGFAASVALAADGATALIGSPCDRRKAGEERCIGAAWVFVRSGSAWALQEKLIGRGEANGKGGGRFGTAVALSGDGSTALVGGSGDSANGGAVWAFGRSGASWSQEGEKLVGAGAVGPAEQGASVAISSDGSTALVGGPTDGGGAGAAWTFTRSGATWSQRGEKLLGSGAPQNPSGDFARRLALASDGRTALVGGPSENIAWVFDRGSVGWHQSARLTGETAGGELGQGVALSADGSVALIGEPRFSGQTGAAWAYRRSGAGWPPVGEELLGSGGVERPQQGTSVALAGDANTALVGARFDRSSRGAAWVFANLPTLTIALAGIGSVSGPGIACPGSCAADYAPGTVVTLSAAPLEGSRFSGWGGACSGAGACTVTMNADQTVVALFGVLHGGGASCPGCGPARAPHPPRLSSLSESYSTFAVGASSTPATARTARHHRGTTFSFRLNQPASVLITIERLSPGRRVRQGCVRDSHKLRHRPRCTRAARVATLVRTGHATRNEVSFSGRIAGRALAPGRYRAVFVAVTEVGFSHRQSLAFTIVHR
ncbi:MAG TPA: hypothetical protein VNZ05_10875 [Solirubrobacteraceae bacterium]|jgi:hypothetical protein|nr:hypothetical protein [Solirubrobacteraceae bacterium]